MNELPSNINRKNPFKKNWWGGDIRIQIKTNFRDPQPPLPLQITLFCSENRLTSKNIPEWLIIGFQKKCQNFSFKKWGPPPPAPRHMAFSGAKWGNFKNYYKY